MKRREFITLLSSAAAFNPVFAWAQQSPSPLIGVLEAASALSLTKNDEAFRSALRQLGYVEGRNIRLEYRYADGFLDRLPGLAAELVRLNPKVIVSAPLPANLALHQATSTIPIVMATGADPVGFGLLQSLSHPGGNITGLTNFAEELASKQLDLIREVLPGIARIGALVNVTNPLHVPQWRETEAAAAKASLAVVLGTERVVDGRLLATALVIDRDGEIAGFQDKVQLDPSEDETYSPGYGRRVFRTGPLTFGVAICHEGWRYPETVRSAVRDGAQIVFHPHYHPADPGSYRPTTFADPANTFHEKAVLCRAAENTCYFASVNYASTGSPTTSAVARPDGSLLTYQPYGEAGLLFADIDLSAATGLLAARYKPV